MRIFQLNSIDIFIINLYIMNISNIQKFLKGPHSFLLFVALFYFKLYKELLIQSTGYSVPQRYRSRN